MKENESTNPFYDKKIQSILKKLISEEVIANMFYIGCIAAACRCQSSRFKELFTEIAVDELDDHAKHLIEWAVENEYEVPFKLRDYEKFAAKSMVKQLDQLKTKKEAIYYVEEALKSEEDALKSYEDAMKYEDVP